MTFDELTEAIDAFKLPDMRDRFAMAALTGLLSGSDRVKDRDAEWLAERAYALADAMVAEMGDGRAAAAQRDEGKS